MGSDVRSYIDFQVKSDITLLGEFSQRDAFVRGQNETHKASRARFEPDRAPTELGPRFGIGISVHGCVRDDGGGAPVGKIAGDVPDVGFRENDPTFECSPGLIPNGLCCVEDG